MPIGNGGILGKVNTANNSFAQGIWTLNEQSDYERNISWPGKILYEVITVVASAQLQVTGNGTRELSIQKISGSNSWDAHAYFNTPFTAPITLEFKKNAASSDNGVSYSMIGLNTDPLTNASYDTLDYAAYPYRSDQYSVYHNSSQVHFAGSWSTTSTFYLTYLTDGTMRHYNGPTLLYTVNRGSQTVYLDSSFYSVNAFGAFTNIKMIKRVWDGTKYI
jgi:hypothetical protein